MDNRSTPRPHFDARAERRDGVDAKRTTSGHSFYIGLETRSEVDTEASWKLWSLAESRCEAVTSRPFSRL